MDKILIDDQTFRNGTSVAATEDMGTNKEGVLNRADASTYVNAGTFLLFQEGTLRFNGNSEINTDDMLSA